MVNKKIWLGMLVLALVFGMTVIGCDDGSTSGAWSNVTSLSQVNGTWKGSYTETLTSGGITQKMEMTQTLTINASAGTASNSMTITITFSGANLDAAWAVIKQSLNGFTCNDTTHTATKTESIPSGPITLADMDGIQIDQSGTKLKVPAGLMEEDSPELIFTKQ